MPAIWVAAFSMTSPAFEAFSRATSGTGASVVETPSRIAVFGGALSTPSEVAAGGAPKSRRDAFVRWIASNHSAISRLLLLPESYDDWNDFSTYSDLLRFEEDLGYVTSVVVIFLEAPGSIAELGAFSQIATLNQQLVLVVLDTHHPKKSFISLGPLRQLEGEGRSSVCVVPDRAIEQFEEDVELVLAAVEERLSAVRSRRTLDPLDRKHQIILILDVISLFEVATFGEIKLALTHFNIQVQDPRVKQMLFTLAKAGYIGSRRYGGIDYYFPVERGKTWVDHSGAMTSNPFNRLRVHAKIATSRGKSTPAGKAHALVFSAGAS
ncbi:MAG: retron St85 family effector protein [Burkholderiales bacterium]